MKLFVRIIVGLLIMELPTYLFGNASEQREIVSMWILAEVGVGDVCSDAVEGLYIVGVIFDVIAFIADRFDVDLHPEVTFFQDIATCPIGSYMRLFFQKNDEGCDWFEFGVCFVRPNGEVVAHEGVRISKGLWH